MWLVDLNERGLQDIANEIATHYDSKIYIHACDLELEQSRMELVEQVLDHGDINILINNAAFVGTTGLDGWNVNFKEQSIETWRRAFGVNLTAAFHLSQLFAESLRSAPGGNIINVASIYGQWGPDWSLYEGLDMSNPAAYAASKGRVDSNHKMVGRDYGSRCQSQRYLSRWHSKRTRATFLSIATVQERRWVGWRRSKTFWGH